MDSIEQSEFRLKDRRKAGRIGLYAAVVAVAVAAIAGFLQV